ncbi:MAG: alpha-amylase [Sandaracinaceae bacterium]|nr:alpha-amylase [Sandaracinaceae bacterium]
MKRLFVSIFAVTLLLALDACAGSELADVEEVHLASHVDDWRDEVVYQLLTDRFANGSASNDFRVEPNALARYHGGDYQGVIDHLDYLDALGVTAIWISPIVRNVDTDAGVDGYHGYWAQDLTRLNPHFGDLATLRAMVNACHAHGIKVILDIVTNHLGQVFYYDINLNGVPDESVFGSGSASPLTRVTEYDPDYDTRGIQSYTSLGEAGAAPIYFFDMPAIFRVPPMPEIFQHPEAYHLRGRILDYAVPDQVLFGDFPGGLKDVATENPDVREALIASYTNWILQTDMDGFRIDTLKHVEYEFWETFTSEVRQRLAARGKTNFMQFGEAFDGDDTLVGSYTLPGRLDSVFYFPQKFQVFNDIFQQGQATQKIQDLLEQRAMHYGSTPQPGGIGIAPTEALVNFIDNHDLPRFLDARRDFQGTAALRAALAYLLTEDGIPCIYYGTEQDFSGGNDPANREDLWGADYRTDGETFAWIARLTRIRREYTALRRGSFEIR